MFRDTHAFSGFSVNDIAKAKEFYESVLGLEVEESPMGLKLHIAGGTPIFIYAKDDHVPATYTILNFPVADIDSAVSDLTALGVTFVTYQGMTDAQGVARGIQAKRGPDIAWFKDPAGNILSILQDK